MTIVPGLSSSVTVAVAAADTATALGSGDVSVLATPRLVALMERAAAEAVAGELGEGETTVGTRVAVDHLRASAVGSTVRAVATVGAVEGRSIRFHVAAYEGDALLADGEHTRVVVDRAAFMGRLG